MSDFLKDKPSLEIGLLNRISQFIQLNEIERADALLKEAESLLLNSNSLLSLRIRLNAEIGQREHVSKFENSSLQDLTSLNHQLDFEKPSDDDFEFLSEQSSELLEAEYSFDRHPDKKQLKQQTQPEKQRTRKILSLKRNKPDMGKVEAKRDGETVELNKKVKVSIKNKFTSLTKDLVQPDSDEKQPQKELPHKENSVTPVFTTENCNDSNNKSEQIKPRAKLSLKNKAQDNPTENAENESRYEETSISSIKPKKVEKVQPTSQQGDIQLKADVPEPIKDTPPEIVDPTLFDEFDILGEINGTTDNDLNLDDDVFEPDSIDYLNGLDGFENVDKTNDEKLTLDTNESDLFDFWDDDNFEEQDNVLEAPALENTLTQEERARIIAVECILEFGWDLKQLPFLIEIFSRKGWSNSRKAIEREVQAGATFDELVLAYEVKELWQESSRYWINFNYAFYAGESADSTFRDCSWRQVLRLVRIFSDLPTIDEVYDFLEHEFETWYGNQILRRRYPSFHKYLFNHRLNTRNLHLYTQGFVKADDEDGMNGEWTSNPNADEMVFLRESGIDLLANFAPKSYFISDKYTSEYLLEYYRSFGDDKK